MFHFKLIKESLMSASCGKTDPRIFIAIPNDVFDQGIGQYLTNDQMISIPCICRSTKEYTFFYWSQKLELLRGIWTTIEKTFTSEANPYHPYTILKAKQITHFESDTFIIKINKYRNAILELYQNQGSLIPEHTLRFHLDKDSVLLKQLMKTRHCSEREIILNASVKESVNNAILVTLFELLRSNRLPNAKALKFTKVDFNDEIFKIFCQMVENNQSLTLVRFETIGWTEERIRELSKAVEKNKTLKILNFDNVEYGSNEEGATILIPTVAPHEIPLNYISDLKHAEVMREAPLKVYANHIELNSPQVEEKEVIQEDRPAYFC